MGAIKAPVRAKWISPSWILEVLEGLSFASVYDPFCGDAALARAVKRQGKRAIAGDLLEGHYGFALGLVQNQAQTVGPDRARSWLVVTGEAAVTARFAPWAAQGLFTPEETHWLGIWHQHMADPTLDPIEKALGVVAVALTMRYWLGFNRQGQPLKPMSPPVAFQTYLQTANTWVCNRGRGHQALWGDAQQGVGRVQADVLFCYPPTDQGFLEAADEPVLLEAWVKGDPAWQLPGTASAPVGPPGLGLPLSPEAYTEALRRFLARAEHFPLWAIALNDRYPLDSAALVALVQEFRPVIRRAHFEVATGSPGLPPRESLFIARARGAAPARK